jgi:hypothetical protein
MHFGRHLADVQELISATEGEESAPLQRQRASLPLRSWQESPRTAVANKI